MRKGRGWRGETLATRGAALGFYLEHAFQADLRRNMRDVRVTDRDREMGVGSFRLVAYRL